MQKAIAVALDLDLRETAIVCANIQLRDKLNILRTAASVANHRNAKKAAKILTEIGDLTPRRNMMAHDFFFPSPKEPAVQFSVIKAKGKFDMPATLWTVDQFYEAYEKIDDLIDRLSKCRGAFKARKNPAYEREKAARSEKDRSSWTAEPEDRRPRPSRSPPGSPKANPQKHTRTSQG